MLNHEQETQITCDLVIKKLKAEKKIKFRPMRRRASINTKKSYAIGRTNLKTGLITIDILTPKKREPKKISSILTTLCHEIAHHQKRPFKQYFKGRWIVRQHYPEFYEQVTNNIKIIKEDLELGKFFI
jgi:hypothetical protein